jgi:transposase-like protein
VISQSGRKKYGRRYDAQFKRDAVALVASGKPYTTVARDLGVSTCALQRWLQLAALVAEQQATVAAEPPEEQELRRLRQELEEVRLHRDILKKALAICSTAPTPASH